jgi:hypothetical protein
MGELIAVALLLLLLLFLLLLPCNNFQRIPL